MKAKKFLLVALFGIISHYSQAQTISVAAMFRQELSTLQVTERDISRVIFTYAEGNQTVVEVQSNVQLEEFESTMDKSVDVYNTYEKDGFFFYELLFSTGKTYTGRKLKISSYGCDTHLQPLDLEAKVSVGLLVINETKHKADGLYNAGKFSEALNEYEKLYCINPKDEYVKDRIKSCNDKINNSPELNFVFKGVRKKQNPSVKLYLDNQLIGDGNFNDGFDIKYPDIKSNKHELRVVWSSDIPSKNYNINTAVKKVFEFDSETNGFGGYTFILLKE
jgi:tetratricopeptide (TPR) repeat protein